MSAHKTYNLEKKDLLFWQIIWQFLSKQEFLIVPQSLDNTENLSEFGNKTFTPKIPSNGAQNIETFHDAINLLKDLQKALFKKNYTINFLEWNYLGRSNEKSQYFQYIEDLFWKNQTGESVQNLDNLREVIDHPWKITDHIEEIDFDIKPPFEFFSEKTLEFLNNLESKLTKWQLNPFLINDENGSFHWKLSIKNKYLLQGSIYKNGNHLTHKFIIDQKLDENNL